MVFAVLSIFAYCISVLFITPMLIKIQSGGSAEKPNKKLFFCTALFAIIFHFLSLIPLFSSLLGGQEFTLMEIGSLLSLIVAILATFAMLRINTLWFLLPIVYCLSVISLVLAIFMPSHILILLSQDIGLLLHIVLALFAYAVCFITTLYAIQLAWIDRNLKNKKLSFSPMIPPLMTVERHFFRLLSAGELLLTLTLVSGAIYLADFFAPQNIQKAVFTFIAWIVFGILLIGHRKFYWRGKRVIIYTVSGMILLTVAYFGSRAMLNI